MEFAIPTPTIETCSRRTGLPENAFAAASLLGWLQLAAQAGVRSVSASVVAQIEIDALMEFDQDTPRSREAQDRLDHVNAGLSKDTMLRWDCCAGFGLKLDMSQDGSAGEKCSQLHADDPRAFDILYEFPLVEVAVLQRPWVEARRHEGWPVEYRAFISNGEVVGVSNYYPQMTLPASEQVMQEVEAVRRSAQAILEALVLQGKTPWVNWPSNVPEQWQRDIQCTLDFIVQDDGLVAFLEGGPGWGVGAHPCCFLLDSGEVQPVRGIALGVGDYLEFSQQDPDITEIS